MLGVLIERQVRWVLRAPRRWSIVALAAMALGAFGITRITLEDDARAMIADAAPEIGVQLAALSEFTAIDQMLIHLDGSAVDPEANDTPLATRLVAAARQVADLLIESGQFSDARFEAGATAQLHFAEAVLPRRLLLDPRDPAETFAPATLRAHLIETREALLAPQGIMQKSFLLRDPIGSLAAALAPLSNAPGLSELDASSGRFYSRDGTSLLLLVSPKGDPFAGKDAARSMAVIARARARLAETEPEMVLRPIGAHRYQEDAQSMVRRDVYLSAGMTLVIIIAIFVAFFRRLRLALVALPPLAFGACFAGGVAGLWGVAVHPIVLAFAGACLGLSIDYTIHLLASYAGSSEASADARLCAAARRIGSSLALAAASTVAGLFALSLSSVPAMQQMAVVAAAAVIGAFVGNLIWVPILLPVLAPQLAPAPVRRGPWSAVVRVASARPATVVAVAALIGLLAFVPLRDMRIDGDIRNLDTHTAAAIADETAFATAFGDPTTAALILVEGANMAATLERVERATDILRGHRVSKIMSPSIVAPSATKVRARRDAWCRNSDGLPSYSARLDAAAVEVGFKSGAFAGFDQDLRALCAGDDQQARESTVALDALGDLLGRPLVREADGGFRMAVAFETSDAQIAEVRPLLAAVGGLTLVNRAALNQRLVELIAAELPLLGGVAIGLVALLLVLAFRNITQPLFALIPCLLGVGATLGLLAAFDVPINLMNFCLIPLLCGLGIDYGILMTDLDPQADIEERAERAFSVTVAAATTMAGFGTLSIARYYAIATIGRSVLLAVAACAIAALFLPVALQRLTQRAPTRTPPVSPT